jgi:hypothetical protein
LFALAFCAVRERSTEALFAVPYSLYSTLLLWWIWPYALLTCQKSVWLTRKARHGPALAELAPSPQNRSDLSPVFCKYRADGAWADAMVARSGKVPPTGEGRSWPRFRDIRLSA